MTDLIKYPIFASLFLIFIFLMPLSGAFAQVVNVERHRITADTVDIWSGGLGLGLNVSKNKTRIIRVNTSADLSYTSKKHNYLLLGRNNFLRVKDDNVLNDGFIHLRSVLFHNNTYAPEFFVQAQYNLDWGLYRRALAGSNIRIRLLHRNQFNAYVSTGLMFENEIWKNNNDLKEREVTNYLKSTTSFNVRGQLTDNLRLAAISYYQARPDDFLKPRFTSDWQLRFLISENLVFSIQFVSTLDANPPLGSADFIYNINHLFEVRF